MYNGMTEKCYWGWVARKMDYAYLAAFSNLAAFSDILEIIAADREIEIAERTLTRFQGTQEQRVLMALEYGYHTSDVIAGILKMRTETVSANLSSLCGKGLCRKKKEIQLSKKGQVTHFYERCNESTDLRTLPREDRKAD